MLMQIVLFEGFDPLDVIAPFEVLATGADLAGRPQDEVRLVAADGPGEVTGATRGLGLRAAAALDPAAPGYVIVPGAGGAVAQIPAILGRVAQSALIPQVRAALDAPGVTVAAVCGGSLALALAGLLRGRPAVTHTLGMDALAATGARPVRARVVDDGDLVTAGGVTSGLDLGLHLVEREYGPRVAVAVQELFEYERRGTAWRDAGAEPVGA
ncbi:DJ-1/PfpI family protein [Dactylosporangium sp. CA-052675]|uniref:DJ-1/PfpI family protein n=1 Tax=Dactylosporangium sp. CA-052675 TaxID=3239927 RepID=UPI003D936EE2